MPNEPSKPAHQYHTSVLAWGDASSLGFQWLDGFQQMLKDIEMLNDALQASRNIVELVRAENENLRQARDRMHGLLCLIDQRDREWNLFDRPSGGWIRKELKQILETV